MMNKLNEINMTITGCFITGLYYSLTGNHELSDYHIDNAICLFNSLINRINKTHYE